MKTTLDNIKAFFIKKENGQQTELTPIGMCGPCWGRSEWDDKYYEITKNNKPGSDIYESFISKIVDKHVNSTQKKENKYICTSCNTEI
jgi:hypothetical protein